MGKDYQLELRPLARPESVITGPDWRITVLTDRLIRLEYQREGRFVDEPTQRAICREFPKAEFRVMETENSLEIATEHLHLYYDKKPFSREGLTIQLSEGFHVYGSSWSYGERSLNLGGTARTLDGADGAIDLEEGLMSRQGFTVLDDSETALIGPDQWPMEKNVQSIDLYFFGYGHDYPGCLRDFYRLSGHTPLLPRFVLGNWWSRFYCYTEESYLELMDKFREKGIPFSTAVIDMDWHLTDIPKKYGSGWTGYTWNPEFFPDPKQFLSRLHDLGMKVTLNVHPADGVRAHEEQYLPMAKELGIDWQHEDKIPFNASDRKFMDAYFKYLHHPNEERGVDFWWLDWQQGSRGGARGIDTLWLLNHLHFLDSGRQGRSPLTFSRYAGLGSHRYPVGFSGDTYSTWASLDFQPRFTATASNAGYTWWSHDIGGHQGGRRDDELAVRWLQFGVFSPIMRLHSTSNEFYGKEPWNYSEQAEKIMTKFLRLRHRLIPYLHTMNYRTHLLGEPLVRPMYYAYDVPQAYEVPNQYLFGTEMLVCPITKPMDSGMRLGAFDAWLPEGEWFDFFTGQRYLGSRELTLWRSLEEMPVLVRAGGIIPLNGAEIPLGTEEPESLEIHIFNGAQGQFDLYEDGKGTPVITRFRFTPGKTAEFSISGEGERPCLLRFRGFHAPEKVDGGLWEYDPECRELRVRVDRPGTVRIHQRDPGSASPDHICRIYDILQKAQISYDVKSAVYEEVCQNQSLARLFGKLWQMKLEPALYGAVMEQLLSECA